MSISSEQTTAVQAKWDRIYTDSAPDSDPCWVLQNNLHLLPATGRSLDLACGLGSNALCLAANGFDSYAWDISSVGLTQLKTRATALELNLTTEQRNVEKFPPQAASFDVIVVSQFLHRPSFTVLLDAIKPGGLLFYQTFHQHKLSDKGPSSSDYLLRNNELLQLCDSMTILFYREDGQSGDPEQGLRDCAYLVARKKNSG